VLETHTQRELPRINLYKSLKVKSPFIRKALFALWLVLAAGLKCCSGHIVIESDKQSI
jgi:hypothetical protein